MNESLKHLRPFSKIKFNLKSDRVNLVAPASLVERLLIYPMSGRYSTNWDQKGWPGSEIQLYYGCPCLKERFLWDLPYKFVLLLSFIIWITFYHMIYCHCLCYLLYIKSVKYGDLGWVGKEFLLKKLIDMYIRTWVVIFITQVYKHF